MNLARSILAEFQEETKTTATLLEAVPEDKLDFKPHERSWTLGQLAGHVAEGPAFLASMLEPELDFDAMGDGWKPFVPTSKAELLAKKAEVDGLVAESLEGRDDAFMQEGWTMRKGDQVLWEAPRFAAIKAMTINHTVHHRGQLQVYLRLLDVPCPPIYGPTADVQMF